MELDYNKMLFVGEQWFGSNARSLGSAFRRAGWIVDEIDPACYYPIAKTLLARLARRAGNPIFGASFNDAIVDKARWFRPHIVFFYKGNCVRASTLNELKKSGYRCALYYPDVSIFGHGKDLPQCVPEYDVIFTAKSFGIEDLRNYGVANVFLILHAFDPDVHRKVVNGEQPAEFRCEVSFIGAWSPKKEEILTGLIKKLPGLDLRIRGARWEQAQSVSLVPHITYKEAFGDLYALAIQCAKINLGLLLEPRPGASSGDLTTARTFEIPACGAFMLHERTDELLACFKEGVEVACFSSPAELAEEVSYYLNHESERAAIAAAGHKRCLNEHSYDHRAAAILDILRNL